MHKQRECNTKKKSVGAVELWVNDYTHQKFFMRTAENGPIRNLATGLYESKGASRSIVHEAIAASTKCSENGRTTNSENR